jgi:hypothetical protein
MDTLTKKSRLRKHSRKEYALWNDLCKSSAFAISFQMDIRGSRNHELESGKYII